MKKRCLSLLLLAGLLCAVLSGCGDSSTAETPESRAAANTIVVGIAQDLDNSLDPHKTVKAGTREVMFNVFEGLMKPTPEGDLTPAIASDYQVSEDRLTYTFTLRDGVKFHNGDTVTAEDVVYSIQRCAAATETGIVPVEAFSNITDIQAPDASTVVITLAQPDNEFLSYMTTAVLPADYDQQDTDPVGTGPFKFVSRAAQDSIVLEKFDEYWGTPAQLDQVTFKIIENADSLLMSLQSGAIDLCAHLTSTQVAQLGEDFDVAEGTMNLVQALYLNNAVEPFNNEKVRQAMCYAVNVDEILQLTSEGHGAKLGTSIYPAFTKYFDESLLDAYPYDVEKAKQLLAEAGYEDGFEMTITVPSNYTPHMNVAQVLVEQLSQVGITATIEPVEWETWLTRVYAGRDFESTVLGFDAANLSAGALLNRWTSDDENNMINYNNPEYDAIMEEAAVTTDDAKQTELYKQAAKLLSDTAANVYIQDLADFVVIKSNLDGYQFYPLYVMDLSTVHYVQ